MSVETLHINFVFILIYFWLLYHSLSTPCPDGKWNEDDYSRVYRFTKHTLLAPHCNQIWQRKNKKNICSIRALVKLASWWKCMLLHPAFRRKLPSISLRCTLQKEAASPSKTSILHSRIVHEEGNDKLRCLRFPGRWQCLLWSSVLKMVALCSLETSVYVIFHHVVYTESSIINVYSYYGILWTILNLGESHLERCLFLWISREI
jgi:hypothetical protein